MIKNLFLVYLFSLVAVDAIGLIQNQDARILSDTEYNYHWGRWVSQYNKSYSHLEHGQRREIFGHGISLAEYIMDKKPGIYSMTSLLEDF